MELREELQHTLGSMCTLERELQREGMARVFTEPALVHKPRNRTPNGGPRCAEPLLVDHVERD
jgi:hypothetical protein